MKRGIFVLVFLLLLVSIASAVKEEGSAGSFCFSVEECQSGFECFNDHCIPLKGKVGSVAQAQNDFEIEEAPVIGCEKIKDFKNGQLKVGNEQLVVTLVNGDVTFSGDLLVNDGEENVPSSFFTITETSEPGIVQVDYGQFSPVVLDRNVYGHPLFTWQDLIGYTYDETKITVGGYVFYEQNGEMNVCKQTREKTQCANNIDDDGDGGTDFSGQCVVTQQKTINDIKRSGVRLEEGVNQGKRATFLCGCDLSGDQALDDDEYMSKEECKTLGSSIGANIAYRCETLGGDKIGNSCPGEWQPADTGCESFEDEGEGGDSCVEDNPERMKNHCLELHPKEFDGEICLLTYKKDMEIECALAVGDGHQATIAQQSCASNKECGEEEYCDFDYLVCVSVALKAEQDQAQGELKTCSKKTVKKDCGYGYVCRKKVCIEDEESQVFKGPLAIMEKGVELVTDVTSANNVDYQEKQIKKAAIKLELAKGKGDKVGEEKQLEKLGKRTEKVAKILEKNIEADSDSAEAKSSFARMSGAVGKTQNFIQERINSDPTAASSLTVRAAQKRIANIGTTTSNIKGVTTVAQAGVVSLAARGAGDQAVNIKVSEKVALAVDTVPPPLGAKATTIQPRIMVKTAQGDVEKVLETGTGLRSTALKNVTISKGGITPVSTTTSPTRTLTPTTTTRTLTPTTRIPTTPTMGLSTTTPTTTKITPLTDPLGRCEFGGRKYSCTKRLNATTKKECRTICRAKDGATYFPFVATTSTMSIPLVGRTVQDLRETSTNIFEFLLVIKK